MEKFLNSAFFEPLRELWHRVVQFLPNLFTMLVVLLVGMFLAWLFSKIAIKISVGTKFDQMLEKSGIWSYLRKSGIYDFPSQLMGKFVYWFIFLIFLLLGISALDVAALNQLSSQFFNYLPQFFISIVVLIIGLLLANFIEKLLLVALVNAQIKAARLISLASKILLVIFFAAIVLEILGIGRNIIISAFTIIFGGIVLALSLAFGLGGKELAKEYLEKQAKQEFPPPSEQKDDISHI